MNGLNTYWGLILVYVAYSLPFSVFFLTGFFKTLPSELHEAGYHRRRESVHRLLQDHAAPGPARA